MGSTPHIGHPLVCVDFFYGTNFCFPEIKTLADLETLHDELDKKSAVLNVEYAIFKQRVDALRAVQRKSKRVKK